MGAEAGLQTDLKAKAEADKIEAEQDAAWEKEKAEAEAAEAAEANGNLPTVQEVQEGEDDHDGESSIPTPTHPPLPPADGDRPKEPTKPLTAEQLAAADARAQKKEEEELAKAIHRAETIVDSLDGVSVKLLHGQPKENLYSHMSQFEGFFDAAFVSTRALGGLGQEDFPKVLKSGALLAVESAKYLVPLTKTQKGELDDKVHELLAANPSGVFKHLPHTNDIVPRRKREEAKADVIFFKKE